MGRTKITHIRFRRTELELDNCNLGFFHAGWTPSRYDDILVEYDTFDQLCVFDCPTDLFDYANITEIDIGRCRRNQF